VVIGTGTFGRVYLAKCGKNDKYYAIKVLKKTEIVRLKQVEHINSERLVLSKVHFPFIVDLYVPFHILALPWDPGSTCLIFS
jgi:protein kinase X